MIRGLANLTAKGYGIHGFGIGGSTDSIVIENSTIAYARGGYAYPGMFIPDWSGYFYGKKEPAGGAAIGSRTDGAVITIANAADTVTYVFYYNDVLSAENNKWVYLFHYVQIPTQFDQHDMVLFADGKFSMTITGEAVQVDNVGAANAQEAFEIVNGQ